MCRIFFIHSSVDGHLGCFHVLAIVNSAAMKQKLFRLGPPSPQGCCLHRRFSLGWISTRSLVFYIILFDNGSLLFYFQNKKKWPQKPSLISEILFLIHQRINSFELHSNLFLQYQEAVLTMQCLSNGTEEGRRSDL